ncbi:MAG: type II toxin-antitoxin system prevent-host-death family antitoxin [Patulibacter sp.]
MTEKVGIRELRQNLSRYVDEVKHGHEFVVTERGREVARLIPSGVVDDVVLRLARERGATIPTGNLMDLIDEHCPLAGVDHDEIMQALEEQCAERF